MRQLERGDRPRAENGRADRRSAVQRNHGTHPRRTPADAPGSRCPATTRAGIDRAAGRRKLMRRLATFTAGSTPAIEWRRTSYSLHSRRESLRRLEHEAAQVKHAAPPAAPPAIADAGGHVHGDWARRSRRPLSTPLCWRARSHQDAVRQFRPKMRCGSFSSTTVRRRAEGRSAFDPLRQDGNGDGGAQPGRTIAQ